MTTEKKHWAGNLRDDVARVIATFAFERIATKRYAARIEAAIRLGLPAAREAEKAAAPTISIDWLRAQADRADKNHVRPEAAEELSRMGLSARDIESGAIASLKLSGAVDDD